MASDGETRRLAAIMASDVVGYSRLMGSDEAGTLSAIRSLRKEVWGPKIDEYGGRVVKTTGDGQLTEFASVADAVQCAVEVQRAMRRRNADIPEDHRILRIGINQGDIIVDGDDIYGDGVNVAARLEEIAEPGGICISRKVRDEIRDKLLYALEDLGEQEFKNIARPVRAFRVSTEEAGDAVGAQTAPPAARPRAAASATQSAAALAAQPAKSNRLWQGIAGAAVVIAIAAIYIVTVWQPWVTRVEAANVANMAFPLPDKPSIAVLPFVNLSGDPDQEFLADGISEDITTALSKLIQFFVISRTTTSTYKGRAVTVKQVAEELGVQFVLEGSVQRAGDRLRVNAQQIDALSGRHLWADSYDRDVNDLFAVKDEITLSIASNIGAAIGVGAISRASRSETNSLEAWALYREGTDHIVKLTPEDNRRGRELTERALEIDPGFAIARANLAYTFLHEARNRWSDSPEASYETALKIIEQILEDNPSHAYTLGALAFYYQFRGELRSAIETAERAVALDPNEMVSRGALGWSLRLVGRADEAAQEIKAMMRLSPQAPDWVVISLGDSYLIAGSPAEALTIFEAVLGRPPTSPGNEAWARLMKALALDALGREEEARDQIARSVEVYPARTISFMRLSYPFDDPARFEPWAETWRRLGLPE